MKEVFSGDLPGTTKISLKLIESSRDLRRVLNARKQGNPPEDWSPYTDIGELEILKNRRGKNDVSLAIFAVNHKKWICVGYLILDPFLKEYNPDIVRLDVIHIFPLYRRIGIGISVIEILEEGYSEMGIKQIQILTTPTSQEWWRSLSYESGETRPDIFTKSLIDRKKGIRPKKSKRRKANA